jgi:16S rRNA G966 N2-methylase RsmD
VETLFHDLHNFIVSNIHTDDNNELCFLCLAVLLTAMKVNIYNTSDEIIFSVVKDIVNRDLPELKTLIQTINHENISILAKRISELYAITGKDVYFKLYQEFCKYSKAKDEKNIVLTPDWIVRLMTNELQLTSNEKITSVGNNEVFERLDFQSGPQQSENKLETAEHFTIIDPCVGTGSLIMGAANHNCTLYGVDINRKMYVLCKGLFMLSSSEHKAFHGDVFKLNFTEQFDRIITNPPYSKKISGCHAFEFLTYSIKHLLKKNGIMVAIFPVNQLKTAKTYQKYKDYIFNNCDILKIINLGKCFREADVDCAIIVCRKTEKPNTTMTRLFSLQMNQNIIINIPHGGIIFTELGEELLNKIMKNEFFEEDPINKNMKSCSRFNYKCSGIEFQITNAEMDWTCKPEQQNLKENIINGEIYNKIAKCKTKINDFIDEHINTNNFNFDEFIQIIKDAQTKMNNIKTKITKKHKEYKIGDLFEVVKIVRSQIHKVHGSEKGEYPLISSTIKNKGIIKHISTFDFEGEYLIVSVARYKMGFTSYHNGKFALAGSVKLLKPKTSLNLTPETMKNISKIMSINLPQKYNSNNMLTTEKLLEETVIIDI